MTTPENPPTSQNICKIFVGKKLLRDYVNIGLNRADRVDKIIIVARGNLIDRAVSVAEILKRRLGKEATVTIGSFPAENKFGKPVYVSEITIEISLA
jgi:DNA-binding protein Alba